MRYFRNLDSGVPRLADKRQTEQLRSVREGAFAARQEKEVPNESQTQKRQSGIQRNVYFQVSGLF